MKESCDSGYNGNYPMTIASQSNGYLRIYNFAELGAGNFFLRTWTGDYFEVDQEFTYDNCEYDVKGVIVKSNEKLSIEYSISSECNNFMIECQASGL